MDVNVFMQNVERLCKQAGTNPTTACTQSGAGRNLMGNLKKGIVPSVAKIQSLAEYLGVTTSALLGEPEPPRIPAEADSKAAEALKLFEQLPPEQKTAALGFLEYLLSQGGGGEK